MATCLRSYRLMKNSKQKLPRCWSNALAYRRKSEQSALIAMQMSILLVWSGSDSNAYVKKAVMNSARAQRDCGWKWPKSYESVPDTLLSRRMPIIQGFLLLVFVLRIRGCYANRLSMLCYN